MKICRVVVATIFIVLLTVFGIQNLTKVPLKIVIGQPLNVSLIYIMAFSAAIGFMISVIVGVLVKKDKEEF